MIEDKALTYAKKHNITKNQALVRMAKKPKKKEAKIQDKTTKEFKLDSRTTKGESI